MHIEFITQERLLEVFDYNPDTGVLVKKWSHRICELGVPCNGKKVGIDGFRPPSSHIIWKMMTGQNVPRGYEVDHEDRDHSNDRWSNLRLATRTQQNHNLGISKRNKSGYKGVHYVPHRNVWKAVIMSNGVGHYLGCYDTAEEAKAVRDAAAVKFHGSFAVVKDTES